MLSENFIEFTKENIDGFLKELAKEYRKQSGKGVPAEIILIGGASVLINYGFRNMTTDVDALINASSVMKDAILKVGDRFGLPAGWLNEDFRKTSSYSPKLVQYSVRYKTFSNILTVRTVSAEYLIAMKLRSGRQYKNDLSDVLGILADHEKNGNPIMVQQIIKATQNLYGEYENLPETSRIFIENIMQKGNFEELYNTVRLDEKETKLLLSDFEKEYPGRAKQYNADSIADNLREKADKNSILAQLRKKNTEV